MEGLLKTALVISIIGCINWGLIGMFDYNLVDSLFGAGSLLSRIIYVLVFASGILTIALLPRHFGFDKK